MNEIRNEIKNDLEVIVELSNLVLQKTLTDMPVSKIKAMEKGNRKAFKNFRYNLFRNWKIAQEKILSIQLQLWKENPNFVNLPHKVFFYRSLQRLLDCIIWHHFGPDITDIKRIYEFDCKIQNLFEHNILSHIEIMREINSSPKNFALISDLTSGIRIGDLFVIDEQSKTNFIEVKSGDVNAEILEALRNQNQNKLNVLENDPTKNKQLYRIVKQKKRGTEILKMLKNEIATDDRFNSKSNKVMTPVVHTIINEEPLQCFSKELNVFFEIFSTEEKDFDVLEIENSLIIVAYLPTPDNLIKSRSIMKRFNEHETMPGYRFNWLDTLTHSTFMRPIYLQPISPKVIHKIISKKIIVEFYFSNNKFMRTFQNEQTNIEYKNNKEYRRIVNEFKSFVGSSPFYHKDKGALFFKFKEINEEEIILSEGLFCRILSNLIYPSFLLKMHRFMHEKQTELQLGKIVRPLSNGDLK